MVKVALENGIFEITDELLESIKHNNPEYLVEDDIDSDNVKNTVNDEISAEQHENNSNVSSDVEYLSAKSSKIKDVNIRKAVNKMESFLTNQNLHQQISDAEQIAYQTVIRIKELIHKYVGLPGSQTSAVDTDDSQYNDMKKTTEATQKKFQAYYNKVKAELDSRTKKLENEAEQAESLALGPIKDEYSLAKEKNDLKKIHELEKQQQNIKDKIKSDFEAKYKQEVQPLVDKLNKTAEANNIDIRNITKKYADSKYAGEKGKDFSTSSPMSRQITSDLKLMIGGFKIYPAIRGESGIKSSNALKFFKASTRNTERSLIDNMIDYEMKLRNESIDTTNASKEDLKIYNNTKEQFENMVFQFLHKIYYVIEINNKSKLHSIQSVIYNDPMLGDLFNIRRLTKYQPLDTSQEVIVFTNRNDDIVNLMLIFYETFYQGKAMLPNIKDYWNIAKQVKG